MNALELIRIHLELECIGIDDNNNLYQISCANPDDLPRFYIAHHDRGYSRYFRYDLPQFICDQLIALAPPTALHDTEAVRIILAQDAPCQEMHVGKSYVFPASLSPGLYADAVHLNESHRALIDSFSPGMNVTDKAVFAILAEEQVVSTCESSRENERAGEAWVQTLSAFRGRGYAQQVTAAWASHLQQQGKIPFYSHKLTNLASQSVAHKLGLMQYSSDAAYV
jgi:hypothetical protein